MVEVPSVHACPPTAMSKTVSSTEVVSLMAFFLLFVSKARLLRALLRFWTLLWCVRNGAWHPCGLRFPDSENETPERIDVGDQEHGHDI